MSMRFDARHIGSGLRGVFEAGVMGWQATDLTEDGAHQQTADLNVTFNQFGQRAEADRREVDPPIQVETATWSKAGQLDWCVKDSGNGGVAYAVQTAVNGGSELLIFVPPAAHSHDLCRPEPSVFGMPNFACGMLSEVR
jgi:hypothetical protein